MLLNNKFFKSTTFFLAIVFLAFFKQNLFAEDKVTLLIHPTLYKAMGGPNGVVSESGQMFSEGERYV